MESKVEQLPVWQQAWAWFEANKKPVLWGSGAVVIVGVIVAFVLYQQKEAEVAASEALSNVAVPQMTGAGARGDLAAAYLKVAATYPKSRAGTRALLLAASSLFAEGKYAEAKTQFERFRREYPESPFVGEALLGVAASLDAQGNSREAMTAYKDLISRRPADSVVSSARFALARLHEAQNEPEQARRLYEELERTDPYSGLADESRLRLEELKLKYPTVAAVAAPAATNALPYKIEKR
jgi:TolA-binding protein